MINRKAYLKDPWADVTPVPLTRIDYILCGVAFVLIAVASVPQLASLIGSL
jgi:hypothetical protein